MKAKQEVRKEILSYRNQMTHDEVWTEAGRLFKEC